MTVEPLIPNSNVVEFRALWPHLKTLWAGSDKLSAQKMEKPNLDDLRKIKPHEGISLAIFTLVSVLKYIFYDLVLIQDKALRRVYARMSNVAARAKLEREMTVCNLKLTLVSLFFVEAPVSLLGCNIECA